MTTLTATPQVVTPIPSLSSSPTPSPDPSRLPTPNGIRPTVNRQSPSPSPTPTAGTASPLALPKTDQYYIRGSLPNTILAVSVISAILGAIAATGLTSAAQPLSQYIAGSWARPQLGIYIAAVAIFHLLEFFTTAGWNPQKLSIDAFLLNNGKQYHYAHALGLTEYFLVSIFHPQRFGSRLAATPWLILGKQHPTQKLRMAQLTAGESVTIIMVGSQIIRSLAMIQAAQSFSHIVKNKKHDDHTLVTHGIYSWSRHPAYTGFFYWAVATQLLLGNVFSTIGFIVVLSKFFSNRIVDEEVWLVKFFGDDYVRYRTRVGTKLPFYFSA
ncbi:hypothetical protein IAR55_002341 [Kwoniella newhampshirensis]|uniref:Protein-S-isoprenylcysteine O-methyltransferase n=1 Tax=Kwoniella newhampshirensis TaxID=1651941 RepID=A0AAW0Z0I4_9TREE